MFWVCVACACGVCVFLVVCVVGMYVCVCGVVVCVFGVVCVGVYVCYGL